MPGHLGDRRLVEAPADGDRAGGPLGIGGQPLDPQQERVAQALRGGAATVEPGGEQLLGIQRVALAASEQAVDERGARGVAEDVLERLRELPAVERGQLDPASTLEPLELGQQRPQRVAAVELVAAVREQQHHPLVAQAAGEEPHERARRAVGPVDVLEHEHERLAAAEQVQQLEQRLEQPQLRAGVVALGRGLPVVETGQQRGELRPTALAELLQRRVALSHERAQRAQQRRVRELALALLDCFAAEHERWRAVAVSVTGDGRRARLELADQPGLADSRTPRPPGRGPVGYRRPPAAPAPAPPARRPCRRSGCS